MDVTREDEKSGHGAAASVQQSKEGSDLQEPKAHKNTCTPISKVRLCSLSILKPWSSLDHGPQRGTLSVIQKHGARESCRGNRNHKFLWTYGVVGKRKGRTALSLGHRDWQVEPAEVKFTAQYHKTWMRPCFLKWEVAPKAAGVEAGRVAENMQQKL